MKLIVAFVILSTTLVELQSTPSTPTGFTGQALSPTSIRWNWSSVSGATGYRIFTSAGISLTATTATTWTETGLSPNTQYIRYIKAYDGTGESSSSLQVSLYTRANPPSGLQSGRQTAFTVTISWTSGSGGGVFEIQRAQDLNGSPGNYSVVVSKTTGLTITTYLDTGLASNTTYWYKVIGYNQDKIWQSGETDAIKVTTLEGPVEPRIINNVIKPGIEKAEIQYEVQQEGDVKVKIYTLDGELVKTIVEETEKGNKNYTVYWDSTSNQGNKVGSGLYFVLIKTPDKTYVKKIVVVR